MSKIPLRPLNDYLVVRRDLAEQTSVGGIILPAAAQEKPRIGTVLAVGTGRVLEDGELVPLQVRVGDCVLFNIYGGTTIEHGGKQYLLLREDDVYATIE